MNLLPLSSAILVTLFLTAPIASAESAYDFLLRDIDMLSDDVEQSQKDQAELTKDFEYERDPDLFPEEEGEESRLQKATQVDEGTSTHVRVQTEDEGIVTLDDVPITLWFAPYVERMAERGIISGYRDAAGRYLGKYGPADSVTIEQLAKIAVEAAKVDKSKCPVIPKNTQVTGTWSAEYISCAEHLQWSVYLRPDVDPYRAATRTEVVSTILEAFDRDYVAPTGDVFKDVSNTMPARYAIETAAQDGIVNGYTDENGNPTGYFGPFDKVNRAEIAKMMSLGMQVYGN